MKITDTQIIISMSEWKKICTYEHYSTCTGQKTNHKHEIYAGLYKNPMSNKKMFMGKRFIISRKGIGNMNPDTMYRRIQEKLAKEFIISCEEK